MTLTDDGDRRTPAEVGTSIGHHEAARLILRTWSHLVLTTTKWHARGTCGPVALSRRDLDLLDAAFGGEADITHLGPGRARVTCDIDRYVVDLAVIVVGDDGG